MPKPSGLLSAFKMAGWHELVVPRRDMQPSNAGDSGQVDPRCSMTDILPPQSAAVGLHHVARRLLAYWLTDPVGMARWVGVGTQQPRAGFEPTTLRSQVLHRTTRPPTTDFGRSGGCKSHRSYHSKQQCWFIIIRLSTVTIALSLSLTIRPQFFIECLRRSNQQRVGHFGSKFRGVPFRVDPWCWGCRWKRTPRLTNGQQWNNFRKIPTYVITIPHRYGLTDR